MRQPGNHGIETSCSRKLVHLLPGVLPGRVGLLSIIVCIVQILRDLLFFDPVVAIVLVVGLLVPIVFLIVSLVLMLVIVVIRKVSLDRLRSYSLC